MPVLLYTHPAFARHDPGRGHPERPARLEAVLAGAREGPVELSEHPAPALAPEALEAVHGRAYVAAIERFCAAGGGWLDPDTGAGPASWEAALRAAGAGPDAVERLRRGEGEAAFLAVRPPGHHALPDRAMGFCLFNNLGVTAALVASQGERVAIVDWDVHHGNGTQEVFYEDPGVLYVSLHQYPFYPGTGSLEEVGDGPGRGTTLNFPFPAGTAGDVYREAFDRVVSPLLRRFGPDWVLVSAGYDAHAADPLAALRLEAADYQAMAAALAGIAPGRVVYFLEGGYDLAALKDSVAATLSGTSGTAGAAPPRSSPERSWRALERAAAVAGGLWDLG